MKDMENWGKVGLTYMEYKRLTVGGRDGLIWIGGQMGALNQEA